MSGVNKVILVGRLGADPELKHLENGNTVCTFSLATSESWNDRDGQKQERTEWHKVVVWKKLAEICAKYLAKGRQAYVEGKIQTRTWTDQDNAKRYATEIVASTVQFLNSGQEQSSGQQQSQSSPQHGFDEHEEIPF